MSTNIYHSFAAKGILFMHIITVKKGEAHQAHKTEAPSAGTSVLVILIFEA